MKIYAFHLQNDYSGSPKVLRQLAEGWIKKGLQVTIVTNLSKQGFLSEIKNCNYILFKYNFSSNKLLRLLSLLLSQFILFIKLFPKIKKNDIVYINTVLPFGAGIAGKLKKARVLYHIHETSISPLLLKKILFGFVKYFADEVIYVSQYLQTKEFIPHKTMYTLYNCLEDRYIKDAETSNCTKEKLSNVLMVCSLKKYKGVFEFLKVACKLPNYNFRLIVNTDTNNINNFFKGVNIPENVKIFPLQVNLHPFYKWADLVINLSIKEEWIETFGLTILEGMAFHLPAIVPIEGGITELVEEGKNGFLIDSKDTVLVANKIKLLFTDKELYKTMQLNSHIKLSQFSEAKFHNTSYSILLKSI